MGHHETVELRIKNKVRPIDIKIVPLIRWLNNFESIETQWSCEGNDDGRGYVLFFCEDQDDLRRVHDICHPWYSSRNCHELATIKVDFLFNRLRYLMEWKNEQQRNDIIAHIEGTKFQMSERFRLAALEMERVRRATVVPK